MGTEKKKNEKKKKTMTRGRIKVVLIIGLVLIVLAVVLWGMIPEKTYGVADILEDPGRFEGEEINVKGIVTGWNVSSSNFSLADSLDGNSTLNITHGGIFPEGFGNNATVVVRGVFHSTEMRVESRSIQTGCPSKY